MAIDVERGADPHQRIDERAVTDRADNRVLRNDDLDARLCVAENCGSSVSASPGMVVSTVDGTLSPPLIL
jgi:hypothetical protein